MLAGVFGRSKFIFSRQLGDELQEERGEVCAIFDGAESSRRLESSLRVSHFGSDSEPLCQVDLFI